MDRHPSQQPFVDRFATPAASPNIDLAGGPAEVPIRNHRADREERPAMIERPFLTDSDRFETELPQENPIRRVAEIADATITTPYAGRDFGG